MARRLLRRAIDDGLRAELKRFTLVHALMWRAVLLPAVLLVAACAGKHLPPLGAAQAAPVRFVLTFDDGPNASARENSTERVLDTLRRNPTQNDIKAIFFLQTRSDDGGATARGRVLIARERAEGHVLALHDGAPWGHRSHRFISDAELEQSLRDGVADLAPLRGRGVSLVRPPYWAYDERTLAAYARYGLAPLLTDISANDGKDWGYQLSPRRFMHMAGEMRRVRKKILHGQVPAVDGALPVVITFHDTNSYTATHMAEYLRMIVDKAQAAGLAVAAPPFYAEADALERAALLRAHDVEHRREMVPWWWRWLLW